MRRWEPVSDYTDRLFGHLRRPEQRRWAHVCLQGLLGTPGKKSVRRLAAAASESPTAHQALHQFINESPWDWAPACEELRKWIEARTRPVAWTVRPVVLPKRGELSCGVHRRFVPHTGRTVNCQVGIGVFLSTDAGEFPVRWSLLLPEQWCEGRHRERARVPEAVMTSPEQHILHLTELLAKRSSRKGLPVVVDLDGYMDTTTLVLGLNQRNHALVLAVPDSYPLVPFAGRRGEVTTASRILTDRRTDSPPPPGRPPTTLAPGGLVRLPCLPAGGRPQPFRLFSAPDAQRGDTDRLWLTNAVHRPVDELLTHTDRHAATGATIALLDRDFGLRDFEGRSFPGWHHHMTLLSAAYAYSRLVGEIPQKPPLRTPYVLPTPVLRPRSEATAAWDVATDAERELKSALPKSARLAAPPGPPVRRTRVRELSGR